MDAPTPPVAGVDVGIRNGVTTTPSGSLDLFGGETITEKEFDGNNAFQVQSRAGGPILVEDCLFTGGDNGANAVLVGRGGANNDQGGLLTVRYCTFTDIYALSCIFARNITIENCLFYNVGQDAIKLGNPGPLSSCIVRNNYIHTVELTPGAHSDGVQMTGGGSVIIEDNYMDLTNNGTQPGNGNSCIICQTEDFALNDIIIRRNYLNGTNLILNIRDSHGRGLPTNITVRDNVFGNDFFPSRWKLNIDSATSLVLNNTTVSGVSWGPRGIPPGELSILDEYRRYVSPQGRLFFPVVGTGASN